MDNLRDMIGSFVAERDWDQFHNPKDLAIAITIEASELLEQFLWKDPRDVSKEMVSNEIADVFIYCIQLCEKMSININEAIEKKMTDNARKYPVEKAKGNARKYTEFE